MDVASCPLTVNPGIGAKDLAMGEFSLAFATGYRFGHGDFDEVEDVDADDDDGANDHQR